MKRIAAVMLLATCAPAAAQSRAPKPNPPRAKTRAAAPDPKSAADADEVERLLDKYVLAQGGVARLLVKTRIMRGMVEMSESNLPGTFEFYDKSPNKSVSVIRAPSGQFLQGFDGSKGWGQTPWGPAFTLAHSAGSLSESAASRAGGGFKWRSLFSSTSLRGKAVVDGHETLVLAATPKGGRPSLMYFDADSGLLRKLEFVGHAEGQAESLKAVYIDAYAQFDSIKVPSTFRQVYDKFTLTFHTYEVRHNVPIDDALFASPPGN